MDYDRLQLITSNALHARNSQSPSKFIQQTRLKFCQGSKGFLRNLAPSRQDVSSTTEWKPSAQPGSPACRPSDCAGRILSKSSNHSIIYVHVNIFWGVLGSWKLSAWIIAKCSLAQLDGCMSVCGVLMHSGIFYLHAYLSIRLYVWLVCMTVRCSHELTKIFGWWMYACVCVGKDQKTISIHN